MECLMRFCQLSNYQQLQVKISQISLQCLNHKNLNNQTYLYPISLLPAMPIQSTITSLNLPYHQQLIRSPLLMDESTSTLKSQSYLESLGFVKVIQINNIDVVAKLDILHNIQKAVHLNSSKNNYEDEILENSIDLFKTAQDLRTNYNLAKDKSTLSLKSFNIKTNIMDIMIYFTNDSFKCIIQSLLSVQSNIDQLNINNSENEQHEQMQQIHESQYQNFDHKLKDQYIKVEQSQIELDLDGEFNQIEQQQNGKQEDFQVFEEEPLKESQVIKSILQKSDQNMEQQNYQIKNDENYIQNIFQINQFHKLEHLGCKSLNLNKIMKEDYIKSYKDYGNQNIIKINQLNKYHHQPKIQIDQKLIQCLELNNLNKQDTSNNPYQYMQPKLSLFLQIQTIDIRLYQNQSFDFIESPQEQYRMGFIDIDQLYNFMEIKNKLESEQNNLLKIQKRNSMKNQHNEIFNSCNNIQQIDSSLKNSIKIQSNAILEVNYIKKQNSELYNIEQIHYQELQQNIKEKYKMLNQLQSQFNLQRKKSIVPKCFHQFIFKNIMLSLYRLKVSIFKNKNEIKSLKQIMHLVMQKQIIYKFERIAISIENFNIREDISTGQQGKYRIDTFQLPFSYKYDQFLEIIYTNKHFVIEKQIALELSLQPFNFRMRQDVLKFLISFFNIDFNNQSHEDEDAFMNQQKNSIIQMNNEYILSSSQYFQNEIIEKVNKLNNNGKVQKQQIPVFIKHIKISKTQISLSYLVNSLQINEILNQKVDLMNLFNINNLTLQINSLELNQKLKIDKAIEYLIKYYSDDIINNQKLQIIGAIGSISYIYKFAGNLFAIVNQAGKGISIFKLWSIETLSKFVLY